MRGVQSLATVAYVLAQIIATIGTEEAHERRPLEHLRDMVLFRKRYSFLPEYFGEAARLRAPRTSLVDYGSQRLDDNKTNNNRIGDDRNADDYGSQPRRSYERRSAEPLATVAKNRAEAEDQNVDPKLGNSARTDDEATNAGPSSNRSTRPANSLFALERQRQQQRQNQQIIEAQSFIFQPPLSLGNGRLRAFSRPDHGGTVGEDSTSVGTVGDGIKGANFISRPCFLSPIQCILNVPDRKIYNIVEMTQIAAASNNRAGTNTVAAVKPEQQQQQSSSDNNNRNDNISDNDSRLRDGNNNNNGDNNNDSDDSRDQGEYLSSDTGSAGPSPGLRSDTGPDSGPDSGLESHPDSESDQGSGTEGPASSALRYRTPTTTKQYRRHLAAQNAAAAAVTPAARRVAPKPARNWRSPLFMRRYLQSLYDVNEALSAVANEAEARGRDVVIEKPRTRITSSFTRFGSSRWRHVPKTAS